MKEITLEELEFVEFLEDTLIPDLRASGTDATADDFERAVEIIRRLASIPRP